MSRTLEAALSIGLPVFPCAPDKRPATLHGFKDATAVPEAIRRFDWRDRLIGVPTGQASNINVLDIDPRNGGGDWYAANQGRLPATRFHRTRSSGLHLLFAARSGLRCSSGKIAPGIDVRADGGYVIWWPAEGLPYQDYPPSGLPEWPEWIIAALTPKPSPEPARSISATSTLVDVKLLGIAKRVESATIGERNTLTFWAACRIPELANAGQIDEQWCADVIITAATRAGLPYLEAKKTVESGLRSARHG